jgi:hypothetical protein
MLDVLHKRDQDTIAESAFMISQILVATSEHYRDRSGVANAGKAIIDKSLVTLTLTPAAREEVVFVFHNVTAKFLDMNTGTQRGFNSIRTFFDASLHNLKLRADTGVNQNAQLALNFIKALDQPARVLNTVHHQGGRPRRFLLSQTYEDVRAEQKKQSAGLLDATGAYATNTGSFMPLWSAVNYFLKLYKIGVLQPKVHPRRLVFSITASDATGLTNYIDYQLNEKVFRFLPHAKRRPGC